MAILKLGDYDPNINEWDLNNCENEYIKETTIIDISLDIINKTYNYTIEHKDIIRKYTKLITLKFVLIDEQMKVYKHSIITNIFARYMFIKSKIQLHFKNTYYYIYQNGCHVYIFDTISYTIFVDICNYNQYITYLRIIFTINVNNYIFDVYSILKYNGFTNCILYDTLNRHPCMYIKERFCTHIFIKHI